MGFFIILWMDTETSKMLFVLELGEYRGRDSWPKNGERKKIKQQVKKKVTTLNSKSHWEILFRSHTVVWNEISLKFVPSFSTVNRKNGKRMRWWWSRWSGALRRLTMTSTHGGHHWTFNFGSSSLMRGKGLPVLRSSQQPGSNLTRLGKWWEYIQVNMLDYVNAWALHVPTS